MATRFVAAKVATVHAGAHTVDVAFRAASYFDLCDTCRAPTGSACLRCGKPLCSRHAPAPGARCDSCEREFEAKRQPLVDTTALQLQPPDQQASSDPAHGGERRTWLLLATTALVITSLSLTVSTEVFFALLLGVPMLCLGGLEVVRSTAELIYRHRLLEERMQRRRFLAERKPHLRLGGI